MMDQTSREPTLMNALALNSLANRNKSADKSNFCVCMCVACSNQRK